MPVDLVEEVMRDLRRGSRELGERAGQGVRKYRREIDVGAKEEERQDEIAGEKEGSSQAEADERAVLQGKAGGHAGGSREKERVG